MADTPDSESVMQWKTALVNFEGLPLALRVCSGVDTSENRAAFPHLLVVTHMLAEVKSNGLPEDEYNISLSQFDHDLHVVMSGVDDGFLFLVETFSSNRNYYGCVKELAAAQERINLLLASYQQHIITITVRADKAWKFFDKYHEKFPW